MSDGGGRVFEVIDALDGLFELEKRSPTLDGSIPLRAAQACVPLLEGNALGFTVRLTRPARFERRLGRDRFVPGEGWPAPAFVEGQLASLARAGIVPARGELLRAFAAGIVRVERGVTWIWTGLLVRPVEGVWARVARAANRRSLFLDVRETFAGPGRFAPLLLGVTPTFASGRKTVEVSGDLATLAPAMDVEPRLVELADAPELGEAHAAFYDVGYFGQKKRGVTRKYRKLVATAGESGEGAKAEALVARAGPGRVSVARDGLVVSLDRALPVATKTGAPRRIRFANLLAFEARFDGLEVRLDYDKKRLAERAAELETTWRASYGATSDERKGALLYLTKYFTPHVPGEPHFFVKPWSFVRTSPGWSSVVEGVGGDGFDVLRGVVETDRFFATPAVFQVHRLGAPIRVAADAPLADVYPVRRDVLAAGITRLDIDDVRT